MSELTLGLAAIGVAVVAAVLVYNFTQERRARREAQRAFGSTHADALLGDVSNKEVPPAKPSRKAEMRLGDMPNAHLDYVIGLEIARGTLDVNARNCRRPSVRVSRSEIRRIGDRHAVDATRSGSRVAG